MIKKSVKSLYKWECMKTATLTNYRENKYRPLVTCKLIDNKTRIVLGYAIQASILIRWAKKEGYKVVDKRILG